MQVTREYDYEQKGTISDPLHYVSLYVNLDNEYSSL